MNRQMSSQNAFEEEHSARFLFISGRLCLDFVHTGGEGERHIFEAWHEPDDLAAWFAQSTLHLAGVEVPLSNLQDACALREAIWASALALAHGGMLGPADLDVINTAARHPDLVPQLAPETREPKWAAPLAARAALSTIARDAIALFSSEQAQCIRQCANPQCLLLFVDTSRPGHRRWCSMQRCGNRPKTARYRSRHQAHRDGAPYLSPEQR